MKGNAALSVSNGMVEHECDSAVFAEPKPPQWLVDPNSHGQGEVVVVKPFQRRGKRPFDGSLKVDEAESDELRFPGRVLHDLRSE